MTPDQVQAILQDFEQRATRVGAVDAAGRERWHFEVAGRRYDLHYYPDDDTVLKRYVGGAAAAREFTQLQAMQKLHVPAVRVVANLKGFRIGDRRGDATILVHDPSLVPLLDVLARGAPVADHAPEAPTDRDPRASERDRANVEPGAVTDHRDADDSRGADDARDANDGSRVTDNQPVARDDPTQKPTGRHPWALERTRTLASLIALLEALHRERLCPVPLTLDAFARRGDGTVVVRDGAMRFEGVVTFDRLHELDAATRAITTVADRTRFWRHFTDAPLPRGDALLRASARRLARRAARADEGGFATLLLERENRGETWVGRFLRRTPLALPWSAASRVEFDHEAWLAALPAILDGTGDWQTFKSDAAATVRGGTVEVAGVRLDLVAKRPRFKPGARGWLNQFRPSRVGRTWAKTWRMLGLGFRCEVPLVAIERRRRGAIVDQWLIVERVPGPTFAQVDLAAMSPGERERLLYAAGRTLRQVEAFGFAHRDAKHTNWIAWTDPSDGVAKPALIDLDGIRAGPFGHGAGTRRLVRAMRTRPGVTDADVVAIERGYATGR